MNEAVVNLLRSRLERLEQDIKWERDNLSSWAIQTMAAGQRVDVLTTERRAIQDALEVS